MDGLDSYSLKISASFVAIPIHHLITLSIMQQKFPSLWKLAKILPLHKKGNTLERKNYRPVSILSPVSKILERAIYDQLYSYFSCNRIFHQNFMGYRKNRSTMTALLQMYDRWVSGAGNKMTSGIILLDLSAAFDLVNPEILIQKLRVYGLDETFIEWIQSYMSHRKQAVWVDHDFSDWLDIEVGVPQGSILGPLLFIIFSHDLPYLLSCNLDQYADDSTLSCVKPTIQEINIELNENCEQVTHWMQMNELQLNAEKTHLLVGGTSQMLARVKSVEDVSISMNGVQIRESEETYETILGVLIQPNLKWTQHCAELRSRLKARLSGLRKVQSILDLVQRKIVAQSIFQSVLTYCIVVWGGTAKKEIQDLQVLQNQAAQFVLKSPIRMKRREMFFKLDWLTVNQLVAFQRILTVYNIRNSGEPEYLYQKLSRDNFRGNIIVPYTSLTLLKKSFIFDGAALWNSVPTSIRGLADKKTFKNEVRKWVTTSIPMFL